MKIQTAAIDHANAVAAQKLIKEYLMPPFELIVEAGVTIRAEQTWNRFGVPHRCETWRYEFTGADWQMVVRAVFHNGDLLEPLATHCLIEFYDGEDADAACIAANQFLKSLAL